MAKRRGFGDSGTFGNAGPQNRTTPGTSPDRSNSFGGGAARPNRRPGNRRPRRPGGGPPRQRPVGGGTGTTGDPNAPLDTQAEQNLFEDEDYLRESAWGVLGSAGINPGGPVNQGDWLENQIGNQITQFHGTQQYGNNNATFAQQMAGWLGGPVPATAPSAAAQTPLTPEQWRAQMAHVGPKAFQNLARKRRQGLARRYNAYAAGLAAPPTPTNLAGNPALARSRLLRDWQSATPLERGYDSTQYVGPKRTVEF